MEFCETEFGFVVKLRRVEEDEKGIRSWGFDGGYVTSEGLVVETDYA